VTKLFTPIFLEVQCVLFFKTAPPIVPIDFVKRICVDAKNGEKSTCRFVNRLTPMEGMGRASERGLVDVTRTVLLQKGFELQEPPADDERSTEEKTTIASTGGSDEDSAHWSVSTFLFSSSLCWINIYNQIVRH
jgi:tRNA acetyltransferase TAN1